MRAAVVERYGPPEVVRVIEVPRPEPGRDDVLVRVEAVAVTSGDARIRGARFPPGFAVPARLVLGVRRPRRRILGSSYAGTVEAVGSRIRDLQPGDAVCGMTGTALGAHAEHLRVPAAKAVPRPPEVSPEDAAGLLFGGTAAVHFLGKAPIGPGTTVLVNGASGAIGTNAVQLARGLGAIVTAVTGPTNLELVATLGASEVVDHTVQDVAASGARYDVVLDTVGNLGLRRGRLLLREGGHLLLAVGTLGETVRARGHVVAGPAPERVEAMAALLAQVADGRLRVVLGPVLSLDDIAAAHRIVDSGHKVGNVVVRP